jgi:predicted dehydrogenase
VTAPLPIGLIGLGKHGSRYLEHALRDDLGVRVAAISRLDADRGRAQAAELGVSFHADYRDLVADPGVRAVVAVMPPTEHATVVDAVVAARKALLIEKPLAVSGVEAFRLARRIEAASIPCLVAQTLRFSAVVRAVRELRDRVGRLSQAILGQSFEPSRLAWLDDAGVSGGGIILHTGVHQFDLVRHLLDGEVEWAQCATAQVATRRTEDSFVAALGARSAAGDEVLAGVSASRATRSRYGEIRLLGEHGQISADHALGSIELIVERQVVLARKLPDAPTVREVLSEFAGVAAGRPPSVTAADGAAAVEIADACYRSARSGDRAAVRTPEELSSCHSS